MEVDKQFEKEYFNENLLKENEKLPNKVKMSLEKGKRIEKELNNNIKLSSLLNDCINVENDIKYINLINEKIKKAKSVNSQIKFSSEESENNILESIKKLGVISLKDNKFEIQDININVIDFNIDNINCIKKISDHFDYHCNGYVYDNLCFFISKKNEYILAYIEGKSIIFFDINNNNEVKKFNNAHENYIQTIRYYEYSLYDIILSSSYNDDIKIWNYNENLNILTISKVFNESNGVFSSSILFDTNSFYIFCVGERDYIKIYDSSGNFYKNIGTNDESRRFIEICIINEKKYIISGGNRGIKVFNYPSFSQYNCFNAENDTNYHNYGKIIKNNNIYYLIDIESFCKIRIWDFFNKNLIKSISSKSPLGGFIFINNIYLISGSIFNTEVILFDINNGIIIKTFKKHSENVLGIKAIIDKNNKKYIVSYGVDKSIYLWSLNN